MKNFSVHKFTDISTTSYGKCCNGVTASQIVGLGRQTFVPAVNDCVSVIFQNFLEKLETIFESIAKIGHS